MYESGLGTTTTAHEYAWVPTDPMDSVFATDYIENNQNVTGGLDSSGVGGEVEALIDHCRNAIYVTVNSTTADIGNLVVKVTYEYIPTTNFRPWSMSGGPRDNKKGADNLKSVILDNLDA